MFVAHGEHRLFVSPALHRSEEVRQFLICSQFARLDVFYLLCRNLPSPFLLGETGTTGRPSKRILANHAQAA